MTDIYIVIDNKGLTLVEFEICKLVMKALQRKEIAAALKKSPKTVDGYMRILYVKVGVLRVQGFVVWCAENGFDGKGNYTPKTIDAVGHRNPAESMAPKQPRAKRAKAKAARRKR